MNLNWGGGYTKSEVDTLLNDYVPRSGGAVLTGKTFANDADTNLYLELRCGESWNNGGCVYVNSRKRPTDAGACCLHPSTSNNSYEDMKLQPTGTWTWTGTACQISSDQRLKQQISEIDDKLLDAWGDVELVQFKYNDAVDEKGDNARLHTGYVVQQINEACQKHNIDISEYGLYCHEEYPEETEEVEVTQDDGTTKKETRVIRESSEHYSLRYTETLVVECAYLRREVSRLKQQNENLEQRLKMLEQSVK